MFPLFVNSEITINWSNYDYYKFLFLSLISHFIQFVFFNSNPLYIVFFDF